MALYSHIFFVRYSAIVCVCVWHERMSVARADQQLFPNTKLLTQPSIRHARHTGISLVCVEYETTRKNLSKERKMCHLRVMLLFRNFITHPSFHGIQTPRKTNLSSCKNIVRSTHTKIRIPTIHVGYTSCDCRIGTNGRWKRRSEIKLNNVKLKAGRLLMLRLFVDSATRGTQDNDDEAKKKREKKIVIVCQRNVCPVVSVTPTRP